MIEKCKIDFSKFVSFEYVRDLGKFEGLSFINLYLLSRLNEDFVHLLRKLEDVEVVVADHVQKVLKTNFGASWEEIGDDHEMKDTYALSQMKSLEGKMEAPRVKTKKSSAYP